MQFWLKTETPQVIQIKNVINTVKIEFVTLKVEYSF